MGANAPKGRNRTANRAPHATAGSGLLGALSIRRLIILAMGMLMALVVVIFAITASQAYAKWSGARESLALADIYRDMFIAREQARVAQGAISAVMPTPGPASPQMRRYIAGAKAQSDAAFARAIGRLQQPDFSGLAIDLASVEAAQRRFNRSYAVSWNAIQQPLAGRDPALAAKWVADATLFMNAVETQAHRLENELQVSDPVLVEMNKIVVLSWAVRDDAGKDRRHIGQTLEPAHVFSLSDDLLIAEDDGLVNAPWTALSYDMNLASMPLGVRQAAKTADAIYFHRLRQSRGEILAALKQGGGPPLSGLDWWNISEPPLNALAAIPLAALDVMHAHATGLVRDATRSFCIVIGAMVLLLAFSTFVFALIMLRVVRPLAQITGKIETVTGGKLTGDIPFVGNKDEIGKLARALAAFRANALEKQQLEIELIENRIAKEAAETSARARTQFFANMSHELRTPLNAIIGFSDLMAQKLFGPLDGRYQDYAKLIHKSGHHLLDLVSDILDMSKIEAGKLVLHPEAVDAAEIVNDCLVMVADRAQETGITLTADLPPHLPLIADARAVKQVVLNILSNAVKFTKPGGKVDISAGLAQSGNIRIVVRDTGIGIPAAALKRVGHAFEQVSNDPILAREGAGLGLALVRALVDHHGGHFHIDSVEHAGTCVTVEFPASQPNAKAA